MSVKKRVGLALLGIAGLFGMRTPPEPEVIAQMAPAPRPGGAAPPGGVEFVFERGPRRGSHPEGAPVPDPVVPPPVEGEESGSQNRRVSSR